VSFVRLPEAVFQVMREAVLEHPGRELGGILVGEAIPPVWSVTRVYSHYIASDLQHDRFVSRLAPVQHELQRLRENGSSERYLGEWHNHPPTIRPFPSYVDVDAMHRVLTQRVRDRTFAVLVIWGHDSGFLAPAAFHFELIADGKESRYRQIPVVVSGG
jgi:hypothetical protein